MTGMPTMRPLPLFAFPARTPTANDAERMAKVLESTGDYRVLRRMRPLSLPASSPQPTKRGIFVDVETTGLDPKADSIIELAMLPFEYSIKGDILAVGESFNSLRDPGIPIPAKVTELTGITDAMVAGTAIDAEQVATFADGAALIISHNAGFDRPFCERQWPIFASKAWACSLIEIDWTAEGFEGKKLSQIAAGFGFFFDAHRAVDDCQAGVDILSRRLPRSDRTALAALLESARTPRWRLWAEGAPYALREKLKSRGYRWNPGEDGELRAWHLDVVESAVDEELQYLRSEIYGRDDIDLPRRQFTAFDRYKS
ncbi:3'-5' exonuclease [Bradyrhizobium elkanii]|uniref:3'-5' exonuclease n=1 Tax=Bradyrhizobium elkanii TaxID=29448 RepID=UPI0030B929B2